MEQEQDLRSKMKETQDLDNLVFSQVGKRLYTKPMKRAFPSARALVLYTWLLTNSHEYLPRVTYRYIKISALIKELGMSRSTFYRARQELEGLNLICTRRWAYGLVFLVKHDNLREVTARQYLELVALEPVLKTGVKHLWPHNNIYNIRQYICHSRKYYIYNTRKYIFNYTSVVSRTDVVNLYSEEKFCMSGKVDQLNLGLPRLPQEPPSLAGKPLRISLVATQEHKFPYEAKGLNISAFWYWAIQRYRLLGLDFAVTDSYIKKSSVVFAKNLMPLLGSWESIKQYIDWYLARTDYFVQVTCSHNFNFLNSTACYNQFQASKDKLEKVMTTEEERSNAKSVFGRDLDELNADVTEKARKILRRGKLRGIKDDFSSF